MLADDKMLKDILKDMLRNKARLDELSEIKVENITSINISLNVLDGDNIKLVNIKPMLAEPEINATYEDIKETSKIMLRMTSIIF